MLYYVLWSQVDYGIICFICSCISPIICGIEDIMNFHCSLALNSRKIARYFKSFYYLILLNSFYFSIFAFIKVLSDFFCSCICPMICRIENIMDFHG